jgi:WD40 repeat protein
MGTGKLLKSLHDEEHTLDAACFTPDGKQIVTGGKGIWLWDIPNGYSLKKLFDDGKTICSMSLSPDGRKILASRHLPGDYYAGDSLDIIDITEGKIIKSVEVLRGDVCFCPDGIRAVFLSAQAGLVAYDFEFALEFPGWRDRHE